MASPSRFNRRHFLQFSAIATLGTVLRPFPPEDIPDPTPTPVPFTLGRTTRSLYYYEQPSTSSKALGYYHTDTIIRIVEQRKGDPEPAHNPIWLRTAEGWVHSSFVQPVRQQTNTPSLEVPPQGFLAEVTVPYTQAWRLQEDRVKRSYRYYYASTHWVIAASTDQQGKAWYLIRDDLDQSTHYVLAQDLRRIPPEELAPISPNAKEKRIEVDLAAQRMIALEDGQAVFSAPISSGINQGDTPKGTYRIERKQPSCHMAETFGDAYDFPGVPWVCFISWTGVSLHGTYWHNDFGRPRSHGCINLTPEASKWVYRWTEPLAPAEKRLVKSNQGTLVLVY
jgi:hypothetical protein